MFILQALNEINEFSQHSKPPSQKQKLNYNKSWVCAHVFMGWERFSVPLWKTPSQSKGENYGGKQTGASSKLCVQYSLIMSVIY